MDLIRILIAFFIPPLGVFLQEGIGKHFWINLVLTIFLCWVGGMIHAMYIILTRE